MKFLSNGDFFFPFYWVYYKFQHFYIWSFQNGAPNPDGIIRLPSRLPELIVFYLSNNVVASYFYIFSTLIIAYFSFYFFLKRSLSIQRQDVVLITSAFFAINPVFISNLSKIGLVLAVSMLPLCIAFVSSLFSKHRIKYVLYLMLALNVSLIHPFTFTINFFVTLIFFVYMSYRYLPYVKTILLKLIGIFAVGILLNAYIIMPLGSIGTVNKDVLSANLSNSQTDYTALVDIANTGDLLTGLSLSKNVLKDYDYYNKAYAPAYFIGIICFYFITIFGYVLYIRKSNLHDKSIYVLGIGLSLVLILLATVNFFFVDILLKTIINLPGGWMFRSPLKWQLYLPVGLTIALALSLKYSLAQKFRKHFLVMLGVSFLLINGFQAYSAYQKLLIPDKINNFATLNKMNFHNENLLLVSDSSCFPFAYTHPEVTNELNQVFISKQLQVKRVSSDDISSVNVGTFDYVMGCQNILSKDLSRRYNLHKQATFANGAFSLYENEAHHPYYSSTNAVFKINKYERMDAKYNFTSTQLALNPSFTTDSAVPEASELHDVYSDLRASNVKGSAISIDVNNLRLKNNTVYLKESSNIQYYRYDNDTQTLNFSNTPQRGYATLRYTNEYSKISLPKLHAGHITVSYIAAGSKYSNLIQNASFENGAWDKRVNDCFDYDNDPELKMDLSDDSTNGNKSLVISSKRHVACTSSNSFKVDSDKDYLLSFDYKASQQRIAAYKVIFDDPDRTILGGRVEQNVKHGWQSVHTSFTAPKNARSGKIVLYAYPTGTTSYSSAQYDNFSLISVPPLLDSTYIVSAGDSSSTPTLSYTWEDPTKTKIKIYGARNEFNLVTKETYADGWKIDGSSKHYIINGAMNGWVINPQEMCVDSDDGKCKKNVDGSYDLELVAEFTPQRYFYLGLIISGVTIAACVTYLVIVYVRRRKSLTKNPPKAWMGKRSTRLLGRLARVMAEHRK